MMRHSIRSHPARDHDAHGSPHRVFDKRFDQPGDRPERAVLVGVLLPDTRVDLSDPLGELAALAASAGTEVVDSLVQKRMTLSAACALGKGKLAELVERTVAADADVIIFDNDLTPRQIRSLEKAASRKVIDRSELILDIFASRAKTREAQLQVELAQLQYTAPRLRGMWTHLERIAGAGGATAAGKVGGVGTRGPGERQIEVDRRIVNDRIARLKREITTIDQRKRREVKSRSDAICVSLVGYTNSGKSTLMNRLAGTDRYVADQLFATLDTKTVRWDLADKRSVLLSDTVGFVRDIPHHLVASFRATLEEAIHADLLLHVVDISSPSARRQMESVSEVLATLGCDRIPRLVLWNKSDAADETSLAELSTVCGDDSLPISAKYGNGTDELAGRVLAHIQRNDVSVTLFLPHAEGKLVGKIGGIAEIRRRRYLSDGVALDVRIDHTQLAQLRRRHRCLRVIPCPSATAPPGDEIGETHEPSGDA